MVHVLAFITTKPAGEGTGLGLFLCRRFVEEVGGSISVSDGPLGGARFELRLPITVPLQILTGHACDLAERLRGQKKS